MNFWRTFGIHTVSAIETILDKDRFTLEELLEEDEVLQECRSENGKLLAFLTLPATLEKLFDYITNEAEAQSDSVRKFKYPFISCEILCCDVWALSEAVHQYPHLIERLYSFLERPAPLNAALAAHVSKVAGSLLEKKAGVTLAYLRGRPGMVDNFVRHLSSSAVMDLLLKIISCDEEGGGTLEWLCSNELVSKLVAKFDSSMPGDIHEYAAHALADIIQISILNKTSPLMATLESRPVVEALLQHMFAPGSSTALYYGLDVMTELVKRHVLESFDADIALADCPAALQVIIARLPQLQDLLTAEGEPQLTTLGKRVPLGFTRLKVVQFCVPLFFTNRGCVDRALAESDLLGVILGLFFAYEWNNFLHQLVESLVGTLFDGNATVLRRAAVSKFHLPARLAAAVMASEARFAAGGLRLGNHAFLLLLAEHVATAAHQDSDLSALVMAEEGWSQLAEGSLRETSNFAESSAPGDSDSEPYDPNDPNREDPFGECTDSSDTRIHDEIAAAAAEADARFRFGGWQNASDSDSSDDGAEGYRIVAEGAGDLDEAAQQALEELRQLALTAQRTHREGKQASPQAGEHAAPHLERHDTPLGGVAVAHGERFQEVGNDYGTPPPPDEPNQ